MVKITALADHLERSLEPRTIEEIWDLHIRKMAEYGFDRLFYGFTRFRTSRSYGSTDDMVILSNHDQSYLDTYINQGYYNYGPMVRWAAENEGSCSWRILHDRFSTDGLPDSERRLAELNARFFIHSGYTISFRDLSIRAKGAIGLCGQKDFSQGDLDEIWKEHGREIVLINNILHLRITSLPFASPRRALTPRQREALEWVGDGKTMQDIATIMGLTPATVEKHLRLAREALQVETTAQAVLKASFQNQIFITPD